MRDFAGIVCPIFILALMTVKRKHRVGKKAKDPAESQTQLQTKISVASYPTSVQKSYFMLSEAERAVLNTALKQYKLDQSELFLGGG